MKVSLNLIKKYIDLSSISVEEITHRLTFAGVEVESVTPLASATKLVVGQVLTCEKMPDSDHLHLTTVDAGKYGVLHIVCGAPNVRSGLKVIVATDGAKLPGGTIKKGKVRGYESEGMLCSLLELGVDGKFLSEKQKNGIEELPDEMEVGSENVLELLGLDDYVLDLKLLANRSDLYSVYNVAKELETLFERKANIPTIKDEKNSNINFDINSITSKCSQFSIRIVKDIKVKPSPKWLQDALRANNIRSINNIVDIGNYVMLLTGQPLHMYDLDKLPKQELIVKDDYEGDFVALDEKTYKLQKGDIVITSDNKVMCLGGVMGSLECAVDENTKNIAIEAANFDFASVRRTSIRLALSSDSSMRFVKGINPNQYEDVLILASSLLKELCEAKQIGNTNTYLKEEYKPLIIKTSSSYINNRLGTSFAHEQIVSALKRAFVSVKENDDELECLIPDHRIDILGEADLSEEVIRILGFDNVKSELPKMTLSLGGLDERLNKKRIIRNYLRGLGLNEQLSYSLIRERETKLFNLLNKDECYKIINPLSDEHEYVRSNILPSLMNILSYNVNHGNENVSYFEVSDIFTKENKSCSHLSIVLAGNDLRQGYLDGKLYSFYHMKGLAEGLLKLFNIDEKRYTFERINMDELHPGKSAIIKCDGKVLAFLGELHPNMQKEYGLGNLNVVVMEMNLDVLFNVRTSLKKMEQFSRFPTVKRDFAFIIKDDISANQIVQEIKKVNRELIKRVDIFDVYKGEHIKDGYYSIALSVSFSSLEKTLNDNELASLQEDIISSLETKFKAELRK